MAAAEKRQREAERQEQFEREFASYVGERIDFTAWLPVDILLRVILQLRDSPDVLACAHTNARLRRVFFVRNAFGQWLQEHLCRVQGADVLLVALRHPLGPVEDPLALPVPLSVSSFLPYLAWTVPSAAHRWSADKFFSQLQRGQVGGPRKAFPWSSLVPEQENEEAEVEVLEVAALLPAGVHPPVWLTRRLLGLARLVLLGPRGAAGAALSNAGAHPANCATVVAARQWSDLTEEDKLAGRGCGAEQPELCLRLVRVALLPRPEVQGVFAARACGPGARLELEQVCCVGCCVLLCLTLGGPPAARGRGAAVQCDLRPWRVAAGARLRGGRLWSERPLRL